jgi:hypothetical protein
MGRIRMCGLAFALALMAAAGGGACAVAQHGANAVPSARTPGPPPRADVAIILRDGRVLHLAPLPFGALAATPVGPAQFDSTGTRALVIAQFTGAGIQGDWRSANPTFAYLIDAQRRTLTQVSTDGRAQDARWVGPSRVAVTTAIWPPSEFDVHDAAGGALPNARLVAGDEPPAGSVAVSPSATDRFTVYRAPNGRYTIAQVGAARFRIAGVASNGAYAVIGSYLAWIDGERHIAKQIARAGPDLAQILSFAGSPYGDALVPIRPLGTPVYQTAYRHGVAYFTFSHGVQRIVASSSDLVSYSFPVLPHEPVFTVGDGFGVAPDGAMYFIRPEEDQMLFTRAGHYVRVQMHGLDAARNAGALAAAIPTFDPTQDALHTALSQWRFYPAGDTSGQRWVASHLGRLLIGDSAGNFSLHDPPAFPFVVLARTDDGRLWGASATAPASSTLWSSRDGVTWQQSTRVNGDVGAVGTHNDAVWIAFTHSWQGRPMIWLARAGPAADSGEPTGATYAGEQLAFADLSNGFFLFMGATPGWRLDGQGGPLSGFRVDEAVLGSSDANGDNPYVAQRLAPQTDPSLSAAQSATASTSPVIEAADAAAIVGPSLGCTATSAGGRRLTVVTNLDLGNDAPNDVTVMSIDQSRGFALKYAGIPFPLAVVTAEFTGDSAQVSRECRLGPLHADGALERWSKGDDGAWHRGATTSRYRY